MARGVGEREVVESGGRGAGRTSTRQISSISEA